MSAEQNDGYQVAAEEVIPGQVDITGQEHPRQLSFESMGSLPVAEAVEIS